MLGSKCFIPLGSLPVAFEINATVLLGHRQGRRVPGGEVPGTVSAARKGRGWHGTRAVHAWDHQALLCTVGWRLGCFTGSWAVAPGRSHLQEPQCAAALLRVLLWGPGGPEAGFAASASCPFPQVAGLCPPAAPGAPGVSLHPPGLGEAEQVAGDCVSLGTLRRPISRHRGSSLRPTASLGGGLLSFPGSRWFHSLVPLMSMEFRAGPALTREQPRQVRGGPGNRHACSGKCTEILDKQS